MSKGKSAIGKKLDKVKEAEKDAESRAQKIYEAKVKKLEDTHLRCPGCGTYVPKDPGESHEV